MLWKVYDKSHIIEAVHADNVALSQTGFPETSHEFANGGTCLSVGVLPFGIKGVDVDRFV